MIPPFKAQGAPGDKTPESTPDKLSAHKDPKLKDKRGQDSGIASPPGDITSSGKFTTANFREATVTHSPANIFILDQERKLKNLQARKLDYTREEKKETLAAAAAATAKKAVEKESSAVAAKKTAAAADKDAAPTAAAKKDKDKESAAVATKRPAADKDNVAVAAKKVEKVQQERMKSEKVSAEKQPPPTPTAAAAPAGKKVDVLKQENLATSDSKPTDGGKVDHQRKSSTSNPFAELASAPLFAMSAPQGAPSAVKEVTSPPPVTTTAAVTSPPSSTAPAQSQPSSFSYSYETFINKNFSTPTATSAAKEELSSPESASRKRTKVQESGEKKPKVKKPKIDRAANKTKAAKDMTSPPIQMSPPPSPTLGTAPPQLKEAVLDKPQQPKQRRKRKDSNSQALTASYTSSAYARNSTLPITLDSLKKQGVDRGNEVLPTLSPQVSPSSMAPRLHPMGHSPSKGLLDGGGADAFMNGSLKAFVHPPKPLTIKTNMTSPKSAAASVDVPPGQAMPTSMEQLLERQWDQGSAFLMEQGQHFDIASLLNCLHQLRQENQRLEDQVQALSARRDHLLVVNARLSLSHAPPPPLNSNAAGQTNNVGGGGGGANAVPGVPGASPPPRLNNYLPNSSESPAQEAAAALNARMSRSPGQAVPPSLHNHVNAATNSSPSTKPSKASAASSSSQQQQHHAPGPPPPPSSGATLSSAQAADIMRLTSQAAAASSMAAGARAPAILDEQQRAAMMMQHSQLFMNPQHQMMMHLLQQQQAAFSQQQHHQSAAAVSHVAAAAASRVSQQQQPAAAASHTSTSRSSHHTSSTSSSSATVNHHALPRSSADKTKDKT